MCRTDHHYAVQADLPGMSIEDISVNLKGNTLAISGERHFDCGCNVEEHVRLERLHGKFICEVHLPGKLLKDQIKVGYRQGVLSVTVPLE